MDCRTEKLLLDAGLTTAIWEARFDRQATKLLIQKALYTPTLKTARRAESKQYSVCFAGRRRSLPACCYSV
jgi:hypothetical protein